MKITAYICYNKKQSGWRKEEAAEGKAMKKVSVRMLKIIDLLLEEKKTYCFCAVGTAEAVDASDPL